MAEAHLQFWRSPENVEIFHRSIERYLEAKKCNANLFARDVVVRWPAQGYENLEALTCQRFANRAIKKAQSPSAMSGFLLATCALVDSFAKSESSGAGENPFNALFELKDALPKSIPAVGNTVSIDPADPAIKSVAATGTVRVIPTSKEMEVFSRMLSSFMNIDRKQLISTYKAFFTDSEVEAFDNSNIDRTYKGYDLYRLHSNGGEIVKSFISVSLASYEFGHLCYFANYYRGVRVKDIADPRSRDDVRITRGMAIPTQRVLYLMGEIDGGQGLKIMLIDGPGRVRSTHRGLLLSFEDTQIPIASRFVMIRSQHQHSDDAGIATYPEAELAEELGEELEHLKNPYEGDAALQIFRQGEPRRKA